MFRPDLRILPGYQPGLMSHIPPKLVWLSTSDELVKGTLKSATKKYFRNVVVDLASRGCDAVIMKCAEIPLILRREDFELTFLDSTRLLTRAALAEALRKT